MATLLRFDAILSRPAPRPDTVAMAAHRDLARDVAARSIVLLRNEPVDGRTRPAAFGRPALRLAVVGRLADTENLGDHGSSDVWDLQCHTVLDGLRGTSADVVYDEGSDPVQAAVVAGDADVALVVVGYTSLDEGEFMGEMTEAMLADFPPADEPEVAQRYADGPRRCAEVTKPDASAACTAASPSAATGSRFGSQRGTSSSSGRRRGEPPDDRGYPGRKRRRA